MKGVHFQVFLLLVLGFGSQRVVEYGQAQLEDFHFVHRVEMDQDGAYFLLWTPRKHDVVFEVQVMTKGYVGLGFSTNGGMKGGDMFIGWIEDDGSVEHSDRYGISNFNTPRLDPSQDFEVMGGYANDTHTVIRFSRYWVTCDKEHDFPITEDTTRVIWSYHSERRLEYHDNRGVRSLYLKETKEMKPNALVDASYEWDLRSPSVEIPASLFTLYWCTLFKVPKFTRQHQMIGYMPLIDEANLANVHHIIIYECSLNNSEHHFDKWIGQKGAQCYAPSMPMSWLACSVPIIAWAIGASGEMIPDNVGIPVGEEYGGGNYFLLEVHYDNPTNKEGIVDNSGIRVFLTDQPREYEGSVLVLGAITTPLYLVPPGIDWSITTHCTTECTKETMPEGGIKVYSTNLHGHLIATSLKVRHIRDGVELEPFVEDDNYDSNFQQTRIFTNEKTVLPGDTFLTSCGYKKNDYNSTTFFPDDGFSIGIRNVGPILV